MRRRNLILILSILPLLGHRPLWADPPTGGSVCARVKIQLKQEAIMARTAPFTLIGGAFPAILRP